MSCAQMIAPQSQAPSKLLLLDTDATFEGTDAGASSTFPLEAGRVRRGAYMVIKGRPCKVVQVSACKTGKHGHAKTTVTGLDIFTGKKIETLSPSNHSVEIPHVKKEQYTLINIDEGFAVLMNAKGQLRHDLKIFPEEPERVHEAEQLLDSDGEAIVEVLTAMGQEQITQCVKPLVV